MFTGACKGQITQFRTDRARKKGYARSWCVAGSDNIFSVVMGRDLQS